MKALIPIHHSVQERFARSRGFRPRPYGMSVIAMPHEARECIESIVLSIYTDMVNSGASLQETLAAVYLSGCENRSEERRVGKECLTQCRSRWSPYH